MAYDSRICEGGIMAMSCIISADEKCATKLAT
jgi:hypothetical protein